MKKLFDETFGGRTFRDPAGVVSGQSVVVDGGNVSGESQKNAAPQDIWPYSLTDYLKNYIGSMVLVVCVLPDGRCVGKRGELVTVGTDFICILPRKTNCQLLISLNAIKCVKILAFLSPNLKAFG